MGKITYPRPVVLVMAVMARDITSLTQAKQILTDNFGLIDLESEIYPFNYSAYYEKEMGKELIKQFVSFYKLVEMDSLAEVKILTNKIEEELAEQTGEELRRTVNIDPGYLSLSKLVLATTKDYGHRIYLGKGIFAEVTLRYRYGRFEPLDWTYPDYCSGLARDFLTKVRGRLLSKIHSGYWQEIRKVVTERKILDFAKQMSYSCPWLWWGRNLRRKSKTNFLYIRKEKTHLRKARAKSLKSKIINVLVSNFSNINRIYIFGSLAEGRFQLHSDIDVAVEGIPDELFIHSMCLLNDISDDFEFDLVELNHISPLLKRRILEKGVLIYERKGRAEEAHKWVESQSWAYWEYGAYSGSQWPKKGEVIDFCERLESIWEFCSAAMAWAHNKVAKILAEHKLVVVLKSSCRVAFVGADLVSAQGGGGDR